MAGQLAPVARQRIFTDLGLVAPGALLHTYVGGTPSTPLATFSDPDLAVGHQNANPIVASAGGLFGPIYLTPGLDYHFVLTDASGGPIWDQDHVSVGTAASVATVLQGGTGVGTLAAHGVVVGAGAAAVHVTGAGILGQALMSNGAAADPSFQTPVYTLVKAGSGTDTTAAATTVDTAVLPVLTALDTIVVEVYCESVTQQTTTPGLYSATDGASLCSFTGGSLAAAGILQVRGVLKQRQGAPATYLVTSHGMSISGNIVVSNSAVYAATALWTAAWTLGLRHGGVTAGGTFKWQWAVYLLKGQ